MDIFESLENLPISEECFDNIMGLVEEIINEEDVYEPAAYAKDGYNFMATGRNKLNGKLYKVHTKHDKGVTKTKLYAKDGDSACKLVQKAYGGPDSAHTLANESLYNEIADLVEELLSEGHESALMKKYGVNDIQKLPKEVRRKYFPTIRPEHYNDEGSAKYLLKSSPKSRSHHDLSKYKPQEVSHDNAEKKYLPKNIKKVLKNRYDSGIDDSVELQGHRITKNQAGHYLTDEKRGNAAIAKGKSWATSGDGVNKTLPDSYNNYKSYVTPEQDSFDDPGKDDTLKKFRKYM